MPNLHRLVLTHFLKVHFQDSVNTTHARTHTRMHAHTHTHSCLRAMGPKKRFLKRERFWGKIFLKQHRSRMMDRSRQMVPDSWSLVGESVLTVGLCLER